MMLKRFIFLIIISSLALPLAAQNVTEQNRRKKELEEEIAYLDKQLSSNISKKRASMRDLNFIKRKISNRKKILSEIDLEIKKIDFQIGAKERELSKLEERYADLKERYSQLIYASFKNRDQNVWFMYVLAGENFGQGYRRWTYFKNYASAMRGKAQAIRETGERIKQESKKLDSLKNNALKQKNQKEQEKSKLEKEEKSANSIVNQLSRQEKNFRKQLAERKKERDKLNKEIQRILAKAVKEKKSPTYKETPAEKQLSSEFGQNKGKLPWPLKRGIISERYGQHFHPVFKRIKLPFNNGVHISTDPGAQVLSVFRGVVKQVLYMPGYNQCVLIQHGNYYTFYCKLQQVNVKSGDIVEKGTILGTLAEDDGESVLHFQLWNGTVKQNPEIWLSK